MPTIALSSSASGVASAERLALVPLKKREYRPRLATSRPILAEGERINRGAASGTATTAGGLGAGVSEGESILAAVDAKILRAVIRVATVMQ